MIRAQRRKQPRSLRRRPAEIASYTDNSFTRPAVLIFCVALTARLAHIAQIKQAPFFSVLSGDARVYDQWAQRLASGDWMGQGVFYQAPLYPYFLGAIYTLCGRNLLAVRVSQAVLGSIACVCLGLAARNLFSKQIGRLAGLMLALYAPAIFFDALVQKSVLDVLFICIMLWIVSVLTLDSSRPRHWFLLGLAMGSLTLTRENAVALVAVALLWALYLARTKLLGRDLLLNAGMFLLGLSVVLAPVALRNSLLGGGLYLTTSQFGPNLFIGNNARADGTYAPLRVGRGAPEYEQKDATDLAEQATGRQLTPAEVSRYWQRQTLAFVTSHPMRWLQLLGRKVVLLCNATEVVDTESEAMHAESSVLLHVLRRVGHFGVLVPVAVLGMIVSWRRTSLRIVYAMLFTYAVSVAIFYVFARYRFPLVPFLILFASAGLGALREVRQRASAHWKLAVGATLVTVAVFVNWPVLDPALMDATSENNLGSALQSDGRLDEAMQHYRRALAFRPEYAQPYNNIGTLLRATGRPKEAVAYYERALQFDAWLTPAHVNWGNALLDLANYADAIAHFRSGLQAEPDSVPILNGLAAALAGNGESAAAIQTLRRAVEIDPNSAETHSNLGSALAAAGAIADGIDHLRRAASLEPSIASTHRRLGDVLLNERQFDEAIAQYQVVIALEPNSGRAHEDLGIALASGGRVDEGISEFRRALALQPDLPNVRRNLEAALGARRVEGRTTP